jgi:hypothetical protein
MAYIGKQPVVGNFQKCDAISVVNGQAAYSLTVGSAAVTPENANHMLVSLNGVLQAPGDSFTVSGSTLTFASNLATGDVIDFVIILGDVLDLGTPSDNSISTAKLVANSVTAAKFNADVISGQTELAATPADTDELLISDAGVIKRIDYSYIKSSPTHTLLSTNTISGATSSVAFTSTQITSTYRDYLITGSEIDQDTDSATLRFFMSTDNGSSYETSNNRYVSKGYADNGGDTSAQSGGDNRFEIHTTGSTETAGRTFSFRLYLHNPLGTTSRTFYHSNGVFHQVNDRVIPFYGGGYVNTTSAINNVKFEMSSGDFDGGVFKIYGIT